MIKRRDFIRGAGALVVASSVPLPARASGGLFDPKLSGKTVRETTTEVRYPPFVIDIDDADCWEMTRELREVVVLPYLRHLVTSVDEIEVFEEIKTIDIHYEHGRKPPGFHDWFNSVRGDKDLLLISERNGIKELMTSVSIRSNGGRMTNPDNLHIRAFSST